MRRHKNRRRTRRLQESERWPEPWENGGRSQENGARARQEPVRTSAPGGRGGPSCALTVRRTAAPRGTESCLEETLYAVRDYNEHRRAASSVCVLAVSERQFIESTRVACPYQQPSVVTPRCIRAALPPA